MTGPGPGPGPGAVRDAGRLVYVDNLRASCMLLGVLVHATTLGDFGAFEYVTIASDWFRMATFFMLSGLFAMMLLSRWTVRTFLVRRLRATLVPFVSTLVLLNPVTIWLVYTYHNRPDGPWLGWRDVVAAQMGDLALAGTAPWHMHLWFLLSLAVYIVTAPAVALVIERFRHNRAVARICTAIPFAAWPAAAALVIASMSLIGRVAIELVVEPLTGPVWLVNATVSYWPYFAAGMLCFAAPRLFDRLHTLDLPSLSLLAMLVAISAVVRPVSDAAGEALDLFTSAFGRAVVTFAALVVARTWMNGASPLWAPFVAAIYTLYLVHYILIYALAELVIRGPATVWEAVGISMAVIGLGVLIHRWLVAPSPILSWLFNGKLPDRPRVTA